MNRLCLIRSQRVSTAEAQIQRANVEFDRDAIPIARKINTLREQIKATTGKTIERVTRPPAKHDPEWLIEDQDHFYELQRREARNGKQ